MENSQNKPVPRDNMQRRCDECTHWRWDYTNIYGIGEGRCGLHNTYPDGPDQVCDNFVDRDHQEK